MVLPVQGLKTFSRHVSVNLRGANVFVTQKHLDDAQVRTVVQQMSGECMPQGVR
jgi:hypothetical protein